ncbi:MAG: PTS sugar transporter subunit IIA [Akkermansia sp.]
MSLDSTGDQSVALTNMLGSLAGELDVPVLQNIKDSVFAREETSSTYLDNGLAVPHGRVADLKQIVVVVGVHSTGVNWPDNNKKAKVIVMLGVPASMITGYLVMMQKLLKWHKKTTLVHPDGSIDRLDELQKELSEALA